VLRKNHAPAQVRRALLLAALPLTAVLLAVSPGTARAQGDDDGFSGSFLIGVRSVDVNGAERKFREDLDLEDGPRLFEFRLNLAPEGGLGGGVADRVYLDASNLGGDPYETFAFGLEKRDAYDFRYDRRVSHYFYEDLILPPELANVRGSTGGDFHHFDFERVLDRAGLDLDLTSAAKLHFGFDRFTKVGTGSTTLDLSRDEFELERVFDESLSDYYGSFEYAWDKVTLVLEERYRDYTNLVEIFAPGQTEGENPGPAIIDFYFLDQPYDLTGYRHTARVIARPTPRFDLVVSASLDDAELEVDASERSAGLAFNGLPFATDVAGAGEIQRDTEWYDVDLTYRLTDRVALVAGAHRRDLDQDGELTFDVAGTGRWEIQTTGADVGLEFLVSPTLSVGGGVAVENRDVDFVWSADAEVVEEREKTDREGFFASLSWRPTSAFRLTATAEDNSFDDPFTLASPTDRRRYRVTGRYNWGNGFFASGVYQLVDFENGNSGWTADSDRLALRVGYGREGLDLSLGLATGEVNREIDQLVNGTVLFPIDYQADTDMFDGRVRYAVNDRWAFGGSFRVYDNKGSFALTHDDYRAFVEVNCPAGYLARVGYRMVDYDEDRFDFDDYDADIAEFAIGYRW